MIIYHFQFCSILWNTLYSWDIKMLSFLQSFLNFRTFTIADFCLDLNSFHITYRNMSYLKPILQLEMACYDLNLEAIQNFELTWMMNWLCVEYVTVIPRILHVCKVYPAAEIKDSLLSTTKSKHERFSFSLFRH